MRILKYFSSFFKASHGPARIRHIHKTVQMNKARKYIRQNAKKQCRNRIGDFKNAAKPCKKQPECTDFKPYKRQKKQHFVPCFLIPHPARERDCAKHALAHDKSVDQAFHFGISPLCVIYEPQTASITTSHSAASFLSVSARILRYFCVSSP